MLEQLTMKDFSLNTGNKKKFKSNIISVDKCLYRNENPVFTGHVLLLNIYVRKQISRSCTGNSGGSRTLP